VAKREDVTCERTLCKPQEKGETKGDKRKRERGGTQRIRQRRWRKKRREKAERGKRKVRHTQKRKGHLSVIFGRTRWPRVTRRDADSEQQPGSQSVRNINRPRPKDCYGYFVHGECFVTIRSVPEN